jgi:hypothetical protein
MDNIYPPPGGPLQDHSQNPPVPPPASPGGPGAGPPAPGTPLPRHHLGRALRLSAGIALAAVLIGGGVVAASDLSSGPAAAASGPAGQAAQLNAILSSADSPGAAAAASSFAGPGSTPAAAPVARCRRAAARLRAAGHPRAADAVGRACPRLRRVRRGGGEYGQFTFRAPSGTRTIAFERGTVQSASSSSVVVRAADGTTETWQLTSSTVVRRSGQKAAAGTLAAGDRVFVGGPVAHGARDARLAVIRPASPAPTGSPGGAASGS